jgi:hypothetical protein
LPRRISVSNPQKPTPSPSLEILSPPSRTKLIPFTGNCTPSLLLLQRNTPPPPHPPQRSRYSAPLSRWLAAGGLQLNQTKRLSGVLSLLARDMSWNSMGPLLASHTTKPRSPIPILLYRDKLHSQSICTIRVPSTWQRNLSCSDQKWNESSARYTTQPSFKSFMSRIQGALALGSISLLSVNSKVPHMQTGEHYTPQTRRTLLDFRRKSKCTCCTTRRHFPKTELVGVDLHSIGYRPGCRVSWLFSYLSSVPSDKCWNSTSVKPQRSHWYPF